METNEPPKYWFPAKRYGWGWGPPNNWQGWLVLLGYIVCISAVGVLFPPHRHPAAFPAAVFLLTGVLIAICFRKGEPPAWRWGGDDKLP